MAHPPLAAAFLRAPIAHRGLHDRAARRPENSLSAFAAAIAAGYGIELDVQLTADGQAAVFHDERLDRMTAETGAVVARRAADLAPIGLRDSDDRIPMLAQVLDQVRGQVPLLIELKDRHETLVATDGQLEAAVARGLAGYPGPVAVMSFNPAMVAEMARIAPGIARGLTTDAFDPQVWAPLPPATCARLRAIPDYDATGSVFVSHGAADLGSARIAALRAAGATILCWTIQSARAEAQARRIAQNVTFEGYAPAIPD